MRRRASAPAKQLLAIDEEFLLAPDAPRDAAAHRQFALDPDAACFFGWSVAQARSAPDEHYANVVSRRMADWRRDAFLFHDPEPGNGRGGWHR